MNKLKIEISLTALSDIGIKMEEFMVGADLGISKINFPVDYVINYETKSKITKKYIKDLTKTMKEGLEKSKGCTVHSINCLQVI